MAVAGEELLHALRKGELDVDEAAGAENHDKEVQLPPGRAHLHRTPPSPVDLSAFGGAKLQHQISRLAHGTDLSDVIFEDGVSALVALAVNALEELLGRVIVTFQQGDDLAFKWVELAPPLGSFAGTIPLNVNPLCNRLEVQVQFGRDLGGFELLLVVE